jgi:hypothetical protein
MQSKATSRTFVPQKNTMKKVTLTYWITTALLSLMMMLSATVYFTPAGIEGFAHVGFPQYFRVELALFKILGAVALVLPIARGRLKEWAYFGFFITFLSAFIAHSASGDPSSVLVTPVIALLLLLASYFSYRNLLYNKPVIS